MVLRHFIYLNKNLVSDFFEEIVEEESEISIKKKFNRLYNELYEQNELHILDQSSNELSSIQQHSIIETSGVIRIPEQYMNLMTVSSLMDSNLLGFFESLGVDNSQEINKIEKQGEQIKNLTNKNAPIPIILPAKDTNPIKILGNLENEHTLSNLRDINDKDVFILGKVIKKVEKRKKYQLYSMFPEIMENREQRRKKKKDDSIKNIQVEENGPAIVILPIAIYQ